LATKFKEKEKKSTLQRKDKKSHQRGEKFGFGKENRGSEKIITPGL